MTQADPDHGSEIINRGFAWRYAVATAVGLVVSFVIVARTVHLGWVSGDPTIWIPLHEWMSRGAVLYEGVWDNKDWGFFWFHQPLYTLFGVTGLYFTALLFTLCFALGVLFLVRPVTTSSRAYYIALFAVSLYVASPVYWPIHPENSAIGLAALGVGLIARYPLLAGFFLAGAASVKVSSILILLLVLIVLPLPRLMLTAGPPTAQVVRGSVRLLLGFALGAGLVLIGAAATGSLPGWLEVIDYNGEYAQWRGFPPPVEPRAVPMTTIQNGIADVSELPLAIFAQLIVLLLVALALVFLWIRSVVVSGHRDGSGIAVQQLFLTVALVAATLLITIAQRPSIQHWQIVIGALIAFVATSFAAIIGRGSWPSAPVTIVAFVLLSVPVVTALNHDGSLAPQRVVSQLSTWSELGSGALLNSELSSRPSDSSFMFFGTNEYLVDHEVLPASSELACRFFFQFQWNLPRYGEEILECLTDTKPDFVITDASDRWADEGFRNLVYEELNASFEQCEETDTHVIWCRAGS